MDELLFLGATGMVILLNFIDASYGVHNDFKSHTGVANTFGWFFIHVIKKKLNTKSSTYSELVGVADHMPKVSYFRLFLDAQNVTTKKNFVL